ncbi:MULTISPECIES: immunoglobulin-like domain-containing protein [unclassified Clostridioides]|uniref:immunoglobulin-like domain-containing protein n=1 Tax=unclassified Clostridioides TaxID=2635829 RepID=UPI0024DFFC8C
MIFNDLKIPRGSSFDPMQGVRSIDNIDGDVTELVTVEGEVNVNVIGQYTLKYSAPDKSGNVTTINRTITVVDTGAPIISGADDKTINLLEELDLRAGVTAMDDIDGDLTDSIVIDGTVDNAIPGENNIVYTVEDKSKNKSVVNRIITVVDNIAPILFGVEDCTVEYGSTFDSKAGVTANDNIDGDLTSKIVIEGVINTSILGEQILTYKVTDVANNEASAIRKVTVVDTIKPVFSGIDDLTLNLNENFDALEGVTAVDEVDGDLTDLITVEGGDLVDTSVVKEYQVTYKVSDKSSNETIAVRLVSVIDNIPPVLTGVEDKTIEVEPVPKEEV